MKTKLTYLLMIIMTMTMALGFTSCGDDDENEVITVSIVEHGLLKVKRCPKRMNLDPDCQASILL